MDRTFLERVPIERHHTLYMKKVFADGRVEELPPVHNTIQDAFGVLLAGLVSGLEAVSRTLAESTGRLQSWARSFVKLTASL